MMRRYRSTVWYALCLITILASGCVKDDSWMPPEPKQFEFTFHVSADMNPADADLIAISVTGTPIAAGATAYWKVNGVQVPNREVILLDESDFPNGETVVIESDAEMMTATVRIEAINFNAPYSISYRAKINGQAETNEQNIKVTETTDYKRTFVY